MRGQTILDDVRACASFFTRFPVGYPRTDRPFAAAIWAAPVVGAGIGICVAGVLTLALSLGLPSGPAALLAIAAGVLATGALHEDGLADVADGFGGGKDRAAKLAIMKDSRIGSYGALALGFSLLIRWSALSAMTLLQGHLLLAVLVAAHAASRALLPAFMHRLPSAREQGLSAGVGRVAQPTALVALVLGLVVLLPLGFLFTLSAAVLLGLVFFGLAWLARRQIGGQTGDVLGALQQAAETAVLLTAAAIFA